MLFDDVLIYVYVCISLVSPCYVVSLDVTILLTIQVQWIPISRVAVTSPDYDFLADNIVVNLRELTPNQISFQTTTEVHDRELERGKSP